MPFTRYNIATGSGSASKMPRDIRVVMGDILAVIPNEHKHRFEVKLDPINEWTVYKAPEQLGDGWRMLQRSMIELIPRPTEDWHFRALSIFSTDPADEIRAYWEAHPDEVMS